MFFPKWLWILRYVIAALATISGIMMLTAAFVAPNQLDADFWTNMTDGWEWALGRFGIAHFVLPFNLYIVNYDL